ncbi:hypothetical protein ITX44_00510 [Streptomyces sp. KK5PA1]|uniref:Glycosyl hydrolase family 13 catalytic domain-containing protein n=1 Tax=Actinacidiphila acididurans TaxID=2784346 RepID=A0ABS2TI72_9ACTN|nr:hypothetical protein [Actinacidiphila acididurans]
MGVDAVWLSPFYASPQADAGYDVADYRAVDPMFGQLSDAVDLIDDAHRLDLRVIFDIVPNHCSDQHPWFAQALRDGPGSPARARFHFRPGKGPRGELPPNDWESVFGGPAWTRTTNPDGTPGEWYLHLFAPQQPDFNWTTRPSTTSSAPSCGTGSTCTAPPWPTAATTPPWEPPTTSTGSAAHPAPWSSSATPAPTAPSTSPTRR